MTEMIFAGRTAEQWDEEAARCVRREAESWKNSDTDGYLSQWAMQTMAGRYRDCAAIARDGGTVPVATLFTLDGELVEGARNVETRYGWAWVYDNEDGDAVWVNESKASTPEKRRAAMERKGYRVGRAQATAALNGRTGEPYATRDIVGVISTDEMELY